jgi:isopentenyldiphosphate isomerase
VLGRDNTNRHHLLLARRSSEVRIYAGLWENAPSGTVSVSCLDTSTPRHLDTSSLKHALAQEGLEELGLDLSTARATPIALLEDAEANSLDAVLRIELAAPINPRTLPCPTTHNRWEYADTAWIALADLPTWLAKNARAVSPPTRELIPWFLST